jgi:ABC-type nitrate/sulfonate/bicarbonate transport system substrate-binding protein
VRWIALACVAGALSLLIAACGGGSGSSSNAADSGSTSGGGGGTESVSLQLDWTPNTNHTGFYVAQEKGYYEKAGINLNILPYSEASPDTLVGAGKANCGISFQENVPLAVASGSKEKSVMPILQHEANALIVKKDSEYTEPKDLSGKQYGGFGLPYEEPIVNQMIEYDGGTGEIQDVILNTGSYEAVYHGQVETSLAFRTWELIEAAERGIELREFPVQDYGVPDTYNVVMICNDGWLESNPELAKKFVQATAEGYEYAVKDPRGAAKILIDANSGAFPNEKLVYASAEKLAKEFYDDENGQFGCQTKERWTKFPDWEYKKGIITGSDGKPISTPPKPEELYSNEYAPEWCSGS